MPNPNGELKPGLFATARIEQPQRTPGVLVPAAAVQTSAGTSRVYVVNGDHVEERIVTTGETIGELVEITKGLKAGERVATKNVASSPTESKFRNRVGASCSGSQRSASNVRSSRPCSSSR